MTFSDSLAEWVLGLLPVEELPRVCADALEEGYDSISLAALAGEYGLPFDAWRCGTLFDDALRELKLTLPGRLEAAKTLVRRTAESVVVGQLSPRQGGARIIEIHDQVEDEAPTTRFVGDGLGIERLYGIYYSHDDVPVGQEHLHSEIDAALVEECRRLSGVA